MAMNDKEQIEMLRRLQHEIESLRNTISILAPKAKAYDDLSILLGLFPKQSQGYGEDVVWMIKKKIESIELEIKNKSSVAAAPIDDDEILF